MDQLPIDDYLYALKDELQHHRERLIAAKTYGQLYEAEEYLLRDLKWIRRHILKSEAERDRLRKLETRARIGGWENTMDYSKKCLHFTERRLAAERVHRDELMDGYKALYVYVREGSKPGHNHSGERIKVPSTVKLSKYA